MKQKILSVLIGVASIPSFAVTVGGIDFNYLNGVLPTDILSYSSTGKPLTNISNVGSQLPTDVLTNIYSMLPEGQYVNTAFIDSNLLSNIIIKDESELDETFITATANVTFLNEGAGYRNTLGFFVFDADNPPQSITDISQHTIVFPNCSKPFEGGMLQGDRMELGLDLQPGQALGFFVIPNGWGYKGSLGNIFNLGPWNTPFYSIPTLNPEADEINEHNVVFYDAQNEFFVIGFDDQHRSQGDNDFNDLLFSVEVTPSYAVKGVNENGSVDSGTYQLLQQTNTSVTNTSYYPSQNGYATLAFEDKWPKMGDYDFNDVVIKYRMSQTFNNQNKMIELVIDYQLVATGASYHNGFAIQIPDVDTSAVTSSVMTYNGEELSSNFLEATNKLNMKLLDDNNTFDEAFDVARELANTSCQFYRTMPSCKEPAMDFFKVVLTFDPNQMPSTVSLPPFDPYIYALDGQYHGPYGTRNWEAHLKQFSGSELFNNGLFGEVDDASQTPNYFINANHFPWALNITNDWRHPQESVDIRNAYPKFADWVTSSGEQEKSWYLLENATTTKLYEQD